MGIWEYLGGFISITLISFKIYLFLALTSAGQGLEEGAGGESESYRLWEGIDHPWDRGEGRNQLQKPPIPWAGGHLDQLQAPIYRYLSIGVYLWGSICGDLQAVPGLCKWGGEGASQAGAPPIFWGRTGLVWEWGMRLPPSQETSRVRIASSRPLPTGLGVRGWTARCCPVPPSLPWSSKSGEMPSANPSWSYETPLVLLGDPPLWGALESPLWDPPCPQTGLRTPQHKETPLWGHSWRGQWDNPPAAHRGLCWGCHPRPGLTKGFCHTFSETFSPKQTSHLFTGRQWP